MPHNTAATDPAENTDTVDSSHTESGPSTDRERSQCGSTSAPPSRRGERSTRGADVARDRRERTRDDVAGGAHVEAEGCPSRDRTAITHAQLVASRDRQLRQVTENYERIIAEKEQAYQDLASSVDATQAENQSRSLRGVVRTVRGWLTRLRSTVDRSR